MRLLIAALAWALVMASAPAAAEGVPKPPVTEDPSTIDGSVDSVGKTLDLWHRRALGGDARAPRPAARHAETEVRPTPEFRNSLICFDGRGGEAPAPEDGWCASGVPRTGAVSCATGFVEPRWRRLVYPDGTATGWERLDEGSCTVALPVLTVDDFRSLPIPAPVLRLQPDRGWVLVNIETIVMTDATPVPLRTTLAGFGVDVEAVPTRFTYDFGDGHELVTRSPGRQFPDHDTFHEYEQPGTYAVTLTTEWSGRYRVDGDPTWREVTGTATTSSTSAPFEAQERTSRLVDSLCTDRPTPPDC